MQAFKTVAVQPTYCTLAESKMNEISPNAALRSADDNLFMMFLGMAKIGTYLKFEADTDGDGLIDRLPTNFDACLGNGSAVPVAHSFSDPEIKEIVTGLGQILTNFALR